MRAGYTIGREGGPVQWGRTPTMYTDSPRKRGLSARKKLYNEREAVAAAAVMEDSRLRIAAMLAVQ